MCEAEWKAGSKPFLGLWGFVGRLLLPAMSWDPCSSIIYSESWSNKDKSSCAEEDSRGYFHSHWGSETFGIPPKLHATLDTSLLFSFSGLVANQHCGNFQGHLKCVDSCVCVYCGYLWILYKVKCVIVQS